MAGRPLQRSDRTPAKQAMFLKVLEETGHVAHAASTIKVHRRRLYEWRDADPDFAAAWDDALEAYTQSLEAEADRRGMHGVPEPVYWRGEEVGTIQKYSDTLLMFRLNGMRPEKYRQRHEHTGKDGDPLSLTVIMKTTLAEALDRAYNDQAIDCVREGPDTYNGFGPAC
jgi:hypothetical protein